MWYRTLFVCRWSPVALEGVDGAVVVDSTGKEVWGAGLVCGLVFGLRLFWGLNGEHGESRVAVVWDL